MNKNVKKGMFIVFSSILFLGLVACIVLLSFSMNEDKIKSQLIGKWKLIEGNGITPVDNFHRYKYLTGNNFAWLDIHKNGTIITGASGSYKLVGNIYIEDVSASFQDIKGLTGMQAIYNLEVRSDTMHVYGLLNGKVAMNEMWIKVEN